MNPAVRPQLRSAALVVAVTTLGISWSFSLFHLRTAAYPWLWSLAMPFLAFYYISGTWRLGSWKHLPAAALSIYAVVLWQVSRPYGLSGSLSAVLGIALAATALWLGSKLAPRALALPARQTPIAAPRELGSGVARRRRLRASGARR